MCKIRITHILAGLLLALGLTQEIGTDREPSDSSPTVREGLERWLKPSLTVGLLTQDSLTVPISCVPI